MIPSRKSAAFSWWFARDAEKRVRKTFASVRVRNLDMLARALERSPVLVVSNHTSWWDALVVLYLCTRVLRADTHAMMDGANLVRLPFFALVGAFGVDLRDPRDGARSIRYAAKLLDRPRRLVWIFAQGRETPVTSRPLGFRRGSSEIARVARRATTFPLALRYEHGEDADAVIWISVGEPIEGDHEKAVERELDRIDRALVRGEDVETFAPLFVRRPSSWMRAAQALLAFATRRWALGQASASRHA